MPLFSCQTQNNNHKQQQNPGLGMFATFNSLEDLFNSIFGFSVTKSWGEDYHFVAIRDAKKSGLDCWGQIGGGIWCWKSNWYQAQGYKPSPGSSEQVQFQQGSAQWFFTQEGKRLTKT